MSGAKLGFGATFIEDAQIVEAFVRAGKLFEALFSFLIVVGRFPGELVCNAQAEKAHRNLVLRIDGEDVAADRFCFFRLIEITIVLDL